MIKKKVTTYTYAFINSETNDLATNVFVGSKPSKADLVKAAADHAANWDVKDVVTTFVRKEVVTYGMPMTEFVAMGTIITSDTEHL